MGGDKVLGWQMAMSVISGLAFILIFVTFFTTKERVEPPKDQKADIKLDIKDLLLNKPWLLIAFATVFQLTYIVMRVLVKANSEGQPGPGDYGRTHAEGANMLADALKPYKGVVMWRAFVYNANNKDDRAKQAFNEFKPLDGKFRDNVLIQVKNGTIDFQPREPFHPLFGAMPKTPLMMEFQITQEYLGFSTHLVYLGTLYKEVLSSDTHVKGENSTVAKVIDGSLYMNKISGIAGVANIGNDRNWTGHLF